MAARPSMVVGMAMGLASFSVDACRCNCNGWEGVIRRGSGLQVRRRPGWHAASGGLPGACRRSLVELAGSGCKRGCRSPGAASGGRCWLSVAGGAAERRMPVACGGCWVAAAASLCRPRWLMDWTGAGERVTAAHPTRGRPGCGQPEVGSARPGQQPEMAAKQIRERKGRTSAAPTGRKGVQFNVGIARQHCDCASSIQSRVVPLSAGRL